MWTLRLIQLGSYEMIPANQGLGQEMVTEENTHFQNGPFLQCAVLCERVLHEQDGVKSAIRMIDRITHTVGVPNAMQEMEPFNYDVHLLVRFKSGSARGSMPLQLRIEKPNGESTPAPPLNLYFEADADRGVDVIAPIQIKVEMTGLYWIDVILNRIRVTRVPLRFIYNPVVRPQGHGGGGGPELPPSP